MAEETIYLCNFRVSVDGDWLCLKELADVHLEMEDVHMMDPDDQSDGRDPKTIERANLLNVSKLLIKEIIDSSLAHGRMLDDDYIPLQQFFVVLEHVVRHGLKPKKGILSSKKEFWWVLECIEKIAPEAAEITTSVREMPNIRTPLGRARAWLRLALMQKSLADYFKLIIEKRDNFLVDFYEPGAFLLEEEGVVIAGLLVGLNVLDCNLCIKGEDLDQPMGVIDFSLYMKDGKYSDSPEDDRGEGDSKMATILDQKNYLEELNRHLNATVANLQQKLEQVQADNCLMKEDLAIAKNTIITLQAEMEALKSEKDSASTDYQKQIEAAKQDIDTERETYMTSRAGLDSMYAEAKKQLDEETKLRLVGPEQVFSQTNKDVEKELELQISMKTEMEMALRLLEKDIHEKQDTVISLRKQLDDIKTINLDLYNKLQACESTVKHKTEMVSKLEEKTNQLVNAMKEMEHRLKQSEIHRNAAEETARKLGQIIADKDQKKSALETSLQIEKEWRTSLQNNYEQEKEKVAQAHMELAQMNSLIKDYAQLMSQHEQLQSKCMEQESALAELGSHLRESKLKVEDLREATAMQREAHWASDDTVTNCKQCTKEFSLARRKHHCRYCGDIFCSECSDNKMPLPSSSKPVRVCDNCNTQLLHRYSASS
ncbi:RUN and FYVE domain-containing protein 2-like isoform X3 [Biomphalaria glabrata]|uniref:RUN and FYVE domain-containing protein 2-like isoform X3 n=1 Tax=Biomphalaria glabrata TaxID=6526 RepID=A0A9W2ZMG3_BIOGL|nr:RUN and FYVE domain-containing protein 2-like isoform X3 [Biomphalaria glabrata]XP_055876155.1 RUN and FYVE domain-containing protein 2-like isoform X3 [Biomphalaria glabrata]XP_055876156.1 RUN and FYVE domain-containing protein 2-like isoform X3 [Biomphalaria glabrata]XP_055876157.1 RUN and FYVE domain-containing protein 2-like isoform X3 [Biomphalaria glabrata]XP_055876158.1 RUN and FYVE domain-containing protein 2-like isoform X3 [Biomphalaria glabrata]XP_055876159.1 RUN and FYVE domain-